MTVYFIGGDFDRVKIGYTSEPTAETRLRDLQTGSPVPLKILASCPGQQSDEASLHRFFEEERTHGEWFRLSLSVAAVVAHVLDTGSLDGWRSPAQSPDRAREFAGKFGSLRGFRELGALPDHLVRFRLEQAAHAKPADPSWLLMRNYWPEALDSKRFVHHVRPRAAGGFHCEFGWRSVRETYVDMHSKPGARRTAEYLLEASGKPDSEMAIWLQAAIFQLSSERLEDARTLDQRLPSWEAIAREARRVFHCDWHSRVTQTMPEQISIPEHCSLSPEEFTELVARHRDGIWCRFEPHAVWLEGAFEDWPRRREVAA